MTDTTYATPAPGVPGWYIVNGVNTWWTGEEWTPGIQPTRKEDRPRLWVVYLVGLLFAPAGAICASAFASKAKKLGFSVARYWVAFGIFSALTLIAVISILSSTGGGSTGTIAASSAAPAATAPAAPAATQPVQDPTAEAPAAPDPAATYAALSSREWAQIAKDPASHKGETYIVYGKITQFDSATGTEGFRADAGGVRQVPDSIGFVSYPTNTIFSGDSAMLTDFVEGDLFTAKVTVVGAYSYDTQIGGSTTAPQLAITSISRIGHADI
jgi:hypothetical protein